MTLEFGPVKEKKNANSCLVLLSTRTPLRLRRALTSRRRLWMVLVLAGASSCQVIIPEPIIIMPDPFPAEPTLASGVILGSYLGSEKTDQCVCAIDATASCQTALDSRVYYAVLDYFRKYLNKFWFCLNARTGSRYAGTSHSYARRECWKWFRLCNYAEYKSKQTIVQPLPLERAGPLLFKLITSLEICTQGCVIELARRRPGKPRASFESAESPQPLCVK